jgi:hypothetical protein
MKLRRRGIRAKYEGLHRYLGDWEIIVSPSTPGSCRLRLLEEKAENGLIHVKQRWKRVGTTDQGVTKVQW